MSNGWQSRERDTTVEHAIDTRQLSVRAATVNEQQRSVEAVLSTESRVEVYDYRAGEVIEEVLLADGVNLPRQLPLLNTHSRYSLDDVLGSVREMAVRDANGVGEIVGRLYFAEGDDSADRAWNKVRQGHLTDVSVGYRVDEATDIPAGQSQDVAGRTFTAGNRRLRVATRWRIREASVVPIGADEAAKTREVATVKEGVRSMDPKLREYLESIGLRAEADEAEAKTFLDGLKGEQSTRAAAIAAGETPSSPSTPPVDDGNRQDPAEAARQAVEAERARVRRLREMAGNDVAADVLQGVIDDGSSEERAAQVFLEHIRTSRVPDGAPAGHSRSHEASCNARSLAAAVMISNGIDPTKQKVDGNCQFANGKRAQRSERFTEQDADNGDQFARMPMRDIIRECARLDTGRVYHDPEEMWRAAVSGTSLDRVFTTNVYAMLSMGYMEAPDSTGWVQVEDVPNFMTQEEITLIGKSQLDRHPRGATAKHATAEDTYETYRAYRYSKQFVVDEQDMIDDRLNALLQMPREMGMAAARVRPDLVYSELLANPTLTATTGALFNATAETTTGGHANLTTAALASAALKAGITSMGKKRHGDKVLNLRPAWLIVPVDLEFTARELLTSARVNHTGDTDAVFPDRNVLADERMTIVMDDRIGANGVTDPETGTAYTGTATNWFLAANQRTLKVVYRTGTNRSPQLRSFTLDRGQWGMGWDINLDVGCAAMDYRGLHKSTGAA